MIDIGVNLLHGQFDDDREAVLDRARAAGVTDLLVTSTDLNVARDAIDYCQRHGLHCTVGVHPHDAKDAPPDLPEQLETLARADPVVAIGETGLDFNRNYSAPDVQRRVFEQQVTLAAKIGLPLFVHDRDSGGEVYGLLQRAELPAGVVVHCFTGSAEDLDRYLAAGFLIGITGWVCDPQRGAALRTLIPRIPLEQLLIETDAPFLLPKTDLADWPPAAVPRRHKRRNEPALLPIIVRAVADLRGEAAEEIACATADNARRLFGLSGDLT